MAAHCLRGCSASGRWDSLHVRSLETRQLYAAAAEHAIRTSCCPQLHTPLSYAAPYLLCLSLPCNLRCSPARLAPPLQHPAPKVEHARHQPLWRCHCAAACAALSSSHWRCAGDCVCSRPAGLPALSCAKDRWHCMGSQLARAGVLLLRKANARGRGCAAGRNTSARGRSGGGTTFHLLITYCRDATELTPAS